MFAAFILAASALGSPEVIDLAKVTEAEGIFDRYTPGKWEGKQHNMEPIVTWTKLGSSGGSARVRVTHVNTDEDFIEALYIKDQDGTIVGGVLLSSTDKPDVKIDVPDSAFKLTAYAIGKLHGYCTPRTHPLPRLA